MKLALAALARKTECLIMDEPASPLDPLMRDCLCGMIRQYLEEGGGAHRVLFSTHNIADMEHVTDYCVIMEHGTVVEAGFVEDLKGRICAREGRGKGCQEAKSVCSATPEAPMALRGFVWQKGFTDWRGWIFIWRRTVSLTDQRCSHEGKFKA